MQDYFKYKDQIDKVAIKAPWIKECIYEEIENFFISPFDTAEELLSFVDQVTTKSKVILAKQSYNTFMKKPTAVNILLDNNSKYSQLLTFSLDRSDLLLKSIFPEHKPIPKVLIQFIRQTEMSHIKKYLQIADYVDLLNIAELKNGTSFTPISMDYITIPELEISFNEGLNMDIRLIIHLNEELTEKRKEYKNNKVGDRNDYESIIKYLFGTKEELNTYISKMLENY